MKYRYYPGCSAHGTAWDFNTSTLAVCQALGIEIPEVEDWICCGSTPAHQTDPLLALVLPARNLAAARGETLAVNCAACYSRLKASNHRIINDANSRRDVAEVLGKDYDGHTEVRHFLEILVREIGLDKIRSAVLRPLVGLKVACYYGCLLARPPEVTKFDDPDNPTLMDQVLEVAGATIVDFPYKTECCGAGYGITDVQVVTKLSERILAMAKRAGANCIATACPLCQMNLDLRQPQIEATYDKPIELPVFFFTQLLGMAFDLSRKSLGLEALVVDPTRLLQATELGV
ncbi:MAG TPA: CoB--CoM heterodisulfide reductase iron-sulfur subunit B family protein [Polyangiaceae bacterium]